MGRNPFKAPFGHAITFGLHFPGKRPIGMPCGILHIDNDKCRPSGIIPALTVELFYIIFGKLCHG